MQSFMYFVRISAVSFFQDAKSKDGEDQHKGEEYLVAIIFHSTIGVVDQAFVRNRLPA